MSCLAAATFVSRTPKLSFAGLGLGGENHQSLVIKKSLLVVFDHFSPVFPVFFRFFSEHFYFIGDRQILMAQP